MVQHRLQLDRRLAQHARPGRRRRGGRRDRAVVDEGTVADRPTDRPPGPVAGVRVGERDDPAEVAPAAPVAYQQRQVTAAGSAVGGCGQVDLGAVDRSQPALLGRLGQLHRARERVVVGERQRRMAELARAFHQLSRQRYAVQERVRRVAVELSVGWRGHSPHGACVYQPPHACSSPPCRAAPSSARAGPCAPPRAPATRSW